MEIAPEWLRSYFDLLEIDLEPFFDQKSIYLEYALGIISENDKNSNLIFKSLHPVMDPGQGPCLKCAPGHDSIKDSSIIKSYCLKSGVMEFQHIIFWFWAKSGWRQILNRFAIRRPLPNLKILWTFSNWEHPNQDHPTSQGLGCMTLGYRMLPNREFLENY